MITILFYVNIVFQRYSFQNISMRKPEQISTQTIYSHVQGRYPVANRELKIYNANLWRGRAYLSLVSSVSLVRVVTVYFCEICDTVMTR
jgi:hypothetical protein